MAIDTPKQPSSCHYRHAGAQKLIEVLAPAASAVVVMEPTGNLGRPLAAVLITAGYAVYLVSPTKAARLRKALSSHIKSDRVDAETLVVLSRNIWRSSKVSEAAQLA